MMYGENEGATVQKDSTKTDMQEERVQDTEHELATKKRSRLPKHRSKKPTTKIEDQSH